MPDHVNDHDRCFVAPGDACPACGERDCDLLIWDDDDHVTCTRCGTRYDPLEPDHRTPP